MEKNPYIPDVFYDWDDASRSLHTRYLRMRAAYTKLMQKGISDHSLERAIQEVKPTVDRNDAMRKRILSIFAKFGVKPEEYGFNPWPYKLAGSNYEYAPGTLGVIPLVVAAIVALIGGGVLGAYLVSTRNAAKVAAQYDDIYTRTLDKLAAEKVPVREAVQIAQEVAQGAAKAAEQAGGFKFNVGGLAVPTIAATVALYLWKRKG